MNIVPGFVFTFCFDGVEAAKKQASEKGGVVICWDEDQRQVCLPATDGIVVLPFETREETFAGIAMLQLFAPEHCYGDNVLGDVSNNQEE